MKDLLEERHITQNGKTVILAYDHGLEHGPSEFNDVSVDPEYIFKIALEGKVTAIAVQKGIAEKYYQGSYKKIPLIVKLNGKARIRQGEPFSPLVCSVEEAVELEAAAVGYTIYLGSERDSEMFETFGRIEDEAHDRELPVIAWVYSRGKAVLNDTSPEITAYAARIALELGADLAKIKYCGTQECFSWAVKSAGRCKVVLSGGPKTETLEEFLETVKSVMSAGAAGVAVGRNVWQSENPMEALEKIKRIVFGEVI